MAGGTLGSRKYYRINSSKFFSYQSFMAVPEKNADLQQSLDRVCQELLAIAAQQGEDGIALLDLLRRLEQVHREICEDYFYPTLPERRRDLYNLLRDMEEEGGWPYIARPKLRLILDNFFQAEGLDPNIPGQLEQPPEGEL